MPRSVTELANALRESLERSGVTIEDAVRLQEKFLRYLTSCAKRRADYEHQLDARYAAARGYVDAIVYPEDTRDVLAMALRTALHNAGPHLGAFVLPPHLSEA